MAAPSERQIIPLIVEEHVRASHCIKGATHDVNNQLGAIMAFAELIAMEAESSEQIRGRAKDILSCVQNSSRLLSTLSEMIETRSTAPTDVSISALVEEVAALYHYELKNAEIALETTFEGESLPITVTRVLLVRTLTCMLANAIDRLHSVPRKSIRIHTHEDDQAVTITLRDSATDPPQFNTQELSDAEVSSGQCTLARARDYAHLHHGDLTFEPELGLILRLPR